MELVLSLFTGAGLLDRGFRACGFCVVSGGDILWGHDVREFAPARHKFDGVIGGSPCQEFSTIHRRFKNEISGVSLEMFNEFRRVVCDAAPTWFLLENVPNVPDVKIDGYKIQRFNLNASEVGVRQNRLRCFQFGACDGTRISVARCVTREPLERCCMATEGKRSKRRSFADFCALQGLPRGFDLLGLSLLAKYKAVGNGVPVPMAEALAKAVRDRSVTKFQPLCACGCGRPVRLGTTLAMPVCRKRMQRRRDAAGIQKPGIVTKLPLFPELKFSIEQLPLVANHQSNYGN